MTDMNDFDAGLGRIGRGMRRASAAFDEADAAFIEALEGLKATTLARGTLDERWREMIDTIERLQGIVLEQTAELRAQRVALDSQADEVRALRERLNGRDDQ